MPDINEEKLSQDIVNKIQQELQNDTNVPSYKEQTKDEKSSRNVNAEEDYYERFKHMRDFKAEVIDPLKDIADAITAINSVISIKSTPAQQLPEEQGNAFDQEEMIETQQEQSKAQHDELISILKNITDVLETGFKEIAPKEGKKSLFGASSGGEEGGEEGIMGKSWLLSLGQGLKFFGDNAVSILKGALVLAGVAIILSLAFIGIGWLIKLFGAEASAKQLITFGVTLVGFGLLMWVLGNIMKTVNPADFLKGAIAMVIMSAALIPIVFAMQMLSKVKLDWMQIAQLGAIIVGMGLIMMGLGAIAPLLMAGVIPLLAISMSFLGFALGMKALSGVKVDWITLAQMGVIIVGLGVAMAGLGLVSPLIVAGLPAILAMSLGMAVFATSLKSLNGLKIDLNTTKNLAISMGLLGLATAGIGLFTIPIMLGSLTLLAMGNAIKTFAFAINSISGIPIDSKNIKNFGDMIGQLGLTFAGFALIAIPALAGAGAVMLMSNAVLTLPNVINALNKVGANINNLSGKDGIVQKMGIMLTMLSNSFNNVKGGNLKDNLKMLETMYTSVMQLYNMTQVLHKMSIPDEETMSKIPKFITSLDEPFKVLKNISNNLDRPSNALMTMAKSIGELTKSLTGLLKLDIRKFSDFLSSLANFSNMGQNLEVAVKGLGKLKDFSPQISELVNNLNKINDLKINPEALASLEKFQKAGTKSSEVILQDIWNVLANQGIVVRSMPMKEEGGGTSQTTINPITGKPEDFKNLVPSKQT